MVTNICSFPVSEGQEEAKLGCSSLESLMRFPSGYHLGLLS